MDKPDVIVCCLPGLSKEPIYDPDEGCCNSWHPSNDLIQPAKRPPWELPHYETT